ncbi:uncharacterized protein E0L32_006189 [Thyridium curvatum]|uniref:GDP/GTP exchange factor Sec2 N-terminal domain-containing protein n=1 Tax=Thyridium curvatum TaxID=1093900 RepID=A0A507B7S6_9PEZI|nr:uncharacterized protein E0L32_006189 [Thyridium curvatum]TPX13459.1 hypothetical protein E0L32_006189 [Thyridium curvatum]
MSTTMTMTMASPQKNNLIPEPIAMSTTTATPPHTPSCCPKCGFDIPIPIPTTTTADDDDNNNHSADDSHGDQTAALEAANHKIADLETQIRLLNQKAAAAVDRWADYEDELSRLRRAAKQQAQPLPQQAPPAHQGAHTPPQRSSFLPAGAATRLSALLSPRGRTPPPPPPPQQHAQQTTGPSPPPTPGTGDLLSALAREQALRRQAEGRLSQTSREVEELSASLFEQANEMVATERRARAALEERVAMLERRDAEKRGRLERLESAVGRIERVRALLGDTAGLGTQGGRDGGGGKEEKSDALARGEANGTGDRDDGDVFRD